MSRDKEDEPFWIWENLSNHREEEIDGEVSKVLRKLKDSYNIDWLLL